MTPINLYVSKYSPRYEIVFHENCIIKGGFVLHHMAPAEPFIDTIRIHKKLFHPGKIKWLFLFQSQSSHIKLK